ncbi:DUF4347 domain-containing protein [Stieleria varia]|nr:DUF4347 domain-containing protein [Stieleria varia]
MKKQTQWSFAPLEARTMLAGDAGLAVADVATVDLPTTEQTTNESSVPSVVFVDQTLVDLTTLIDGVDPSAEIVLLDPKQDFIDQIGKGLSGRYNVSAVHLVTHGAEGRIVLGGQVIDESALAARSSDVSLWSQSLSSDADILLYGCHSGSGVSGQSLMELISDLTGADVAASIDRTGADSEHGNWTLERHVGQIDTVIAFTVDSRNRFRGTLNVTVAATGSTGQEIAQLLIDDAVVAQWDVGTSESPFVYQSEQLLTADQIKVHFVNDLYQPELGIDRNLTVDYVEINGQRFESESEATFSTGTWFNEDGIAAGYGRGDTLHANGYFQYGGSQPTGLLNLDGRYFNDNPGTTAYMSAGQLVVTAGQADGVAWTGTTIDGGAEYVFSVDGFRQGETSAFAVTAGPAVVGIDFYDESGVEIGEQFVALQTNDVVNGNVNTLQFTTPTDARYASIWVWVQNTDLAGPSPVAVEQSSAIISSVSLDKITSADTTPPTASFDSNLTITERTGTISFSVVYEDNFKLGPDGRIRVTGPNGFDQIARVAFSIDDPNAFNPDQRTTITFVDAASSSGFFDTSTNGTYTVELLPDSLRDEAGNVAPGQVLGTFLVDVQVPIDFVPPTVSLTTTQTNVRPDGIIQFSLQYDDNVTYPETRQVPDRVTVTGPNGFSATAQAIAGGSQAPATVFEVFYLTRDDGLPFELGEYFVSVAEGAIVDTAGNPNAAGLLGSFQLIG